ncbi:MAG: hypothetical protein J2P37_13810 [Ktedonobacteraceae bacterium]|nr:hypothetical protein [Ktedonobacteraceae bacterium]MBO0795043.1 hypothetical protein [Ktedonobacteraceae bacterium]
MQKRQLQQGDSYQSQRLYTASEVAEFEYCPLAWWHEQFEPLVHSDSEELFAELVAMEHEHGAQAPGLPEYQVIEQLLLRRGAFEEGIEQHQEHAAEVAELEEERIVVPDSRGRMRVLIWLALGILILALLLVAASFFLAR